MRAPHDATNGVCGCRASERRHSSERERERSRVTPDADTEGAAEPLDGWKDERPPPSDVDVREVEAARLIRGRPLRRVATGMPAPAIVDRHQHPGSRGVVRIPERSDERRGEMFVSMIRNARRARDGRREQGREELRSSYPRQWRQGYGCGFR